LNLGRRRWKAKEEMESRGVDLFEASFSCVLGYQKKRRKKISTVITVINQSNA
jgi:hypothetical protein